LQLEVDEDMQTLNLHSSRLGVWGPTPGDVTLLRLTCRFQRGSFHIILDTRSPVPVVFVNQSCYDLCMGRLEASDGEEFSETVDVSSGSRVEWDPLDTTVRLTCPAEDREPLPPSPNAGGAQDLADLKGSDLLKPSSQLESSGPLAFRVQCFLSQQRSCWSNTWMISDRPQSQLLRTSFSAAAEEGSQAPGYEHVLTVSTVHVAGVCCVYLEDGMVSTGPAPPQRLEAPWSRDAHREFSVQVGRVDVQLLDDSGRALTVTSSNIHQALVLPAFLAARAGDVRLEFSILRLQRPEPARPGQPCPVQSYRTLALTLRELEVDNLLPSAEFPVALGFMKGKAGEESRPALDFHFTEAFLDPRLFGPSRSSSMVETITVALRPVRVSVESSMIEQLSTIHVNLLISERQPAPDVPDVGIELHRPKRPDPPPLDDTAGTPRLFFRSVRLAKVSLVLDTRLVLPGGVFLGLDGSALSFQAMALESVHSSLPSFVRSVLSSYATDAILRSPAVLGSLQILGSPTVLLSRLLTGLRDLVVLPAAGTLESGPYGAITGAGKGLLSLTRHVVGGTLSSLAAISSSVRRNLPTGPGRLQAQEEQNTPRVSGTPRVLRSFVNVVATPVRGALDVVWWSSERLINSTGVNKGTDGRHSLGQGEEDQGPLALCQLSVEAYYRRSCRLGFSPQSFVGALGVWVERAAAHARQECAKEVLPAVLVVADQRLFCLVGQHGSESLHTTIDAAHIGWWRQLRADANGAKPQAGLQDVVEMYDCKNSTQLRFWMNEDSARLLRSFLITQSASGEGERMALHLPVE
jgi:hypothetical protein